MLTRLSRRLHVRAPLIQPISLTPGVKTIGENEMIDYLERMTRVMIQFL